MKKRYLFLCFLVGLAIWYGESRKFFCLGGGRCVTVWKTYNNVCYIIPGRYYGIVRPSDTYIQAANTTLLTIYFSPELPRAFVFQSWLPLKVINAHHEFEFYNYYEDTSRFLKMLYLPNAQKRGDMRPGAGLMDIDVHENYATNKDDKLL